MSWSNDRFFGFDANWNFATDSVFGSGNHGEFHATVTKFFLCLAGGTFKLLDGTDMFLLDHGDNMKLLDGTDWLLLDGGKLFEL